MLLIYSNSSRWAGGVEVLVARFAQYLLSGGKSFLVVAPEGGWARGELPPENLVTLEELPAVAATVTHVFAPSIMSLATRSFPWEQLRHAKLFAYVVHPNDIFFSFFPYWARPVRVLSYRAVPLLRSLFRSHAVIFDRLFDLLVSSEAMAVMDGATRRTTRFFLPHLIRDPEVVPIPSRHEELIPRTVTSEGLRVGYLGRMDSMKWSAVSPFLRYSLAPLASRIPIEFVAVAEGTHVFHLKRLCKRLRIRLVLKGFMANNEARAWLAERCDIAVAMGTSALDLAGSGVPAAVLDPALGVLAPRQQGFRYIHESSEWTLGEYRDFPGYVEAASSFAELCQPERLLSAKAIGVAHVRSNHDERIVFSKLLASIHASKLSLSEIFPHVDACLDSIAAIRKRPIQSCARSIWEGLFRA